MKSAQVIQGAFWLGLYVVLSVLPLGLVFLTAADRPGRSFWTELSVGLGFVGLAMMTLQFALTARFEFIKAPYGSDLVYAFHRAVSLIAVGFVLLHPLMLFIERWEAMKSRPFTHPWAFWLGTASVLCLLVLVVVSVWRRKLGVHYDGWRRAHGILASLAVALAVAHILFVGHYVSTPGKKALWLAYTAAFVLLIAYVRLIKPAMELSRPYKVSAVVPQRGGAYSLQLKPEGHPGLRFAPGQFAWITVGNSPFSDREHPFSFSSSSERAPEIEFTIKELGDFTSTIKHIQPGQTVYVDGPFGALSADRHPHAQAFVFIAGGIGITPMLSHLRSLADRGEKRPLVLLYGSKNWDSIIFREELEALTKRLPNLTVVHVLSSPDPDWTGERGFIDREKLARFSPQGLQTEYFICGPDMMMDAVERALQANGVPAGDYHAERFNLA
jgi:3-phenylpropionate/trans-cinnamate dioxygenase ferredoxin reductase subunit